MKKILFSILISGMLHGGTFATVDCTEMNKVIQLLQGYTKVCMVDTTTHAFIQSLSEDVNGTIEYEDGEVLLFTTREKTINVNIEADRPFVFKTESFISDRFKLSLLSDGTESWKYFYIGTSRWRNYDFVVIPITPVVIYPQIIHVGTQGIPIHFTNKIVDVNGTALSNVEVRFTGDVGWEYVTITDVDGIFEFDVTDRNEFTFTAVHKGIIATFNHKLSINIYNVLFESTTTLDLPSDWVVVEPSQWHPIVYF